MLCSAVCRETYIILSQAHSSVDLYSFCFENAETVFTVRHVVEPGFSEAYRGGIVDDSHSQTTTSACSASVQDGSTLCILLGAWTWDRSLYCSETCHPRSDWSGFGSLGSIECNHKPITIPHHTRDSLFGWWHTFPGLCWVWRSHPHVELGWVSSRAHGIRRDLWDGQSDFGSSGAYSIQTDS